MQDLGVFGQVRTHPPTNMFPDLAVPAGARARRSWRVYVDGDLDRASAPIQPIQTDKS